MTCHGHSSHAYEPDDCGYCGHSREEHIDGQWTEANNERQAMWERGIDPDTRRPGDDVFSRSTGQIEAGFVKYGEGGL